MKAHKIGLRLVLLLVLACLLATAALGAEAEPLTEGYFQYTVENGAATVVGPATQELPENLVIPETLGGYPVKAIAPRAFLGNSAITAVEIPGSVELVGASAFYNCTMLKKLTLHEGLKTIGEDAFNDCAPSALPVILPDSIQQIGPYAFWNWELQGTAYSAGERYALCFQGDFLILKDNPAYSTVTTESAIYWISDGEAELVRFLDQIPDRELVLPSQVEGYPVTRIGSYSATFYPRDVLFLVIPGSVKEIGDHSLEGFAYAKGIYLGEGVTSLGVNALPDSNSRFLRTVTLPRSLTDVAAQGHDCDWEGNVDVYAYSDCQAASDLAALYNGKVIRRDSADGTVRGAYLGFLVAQKNGEVTIEGYVQNSGPAEAIPDYVDGCPVTAIGPSAFAAPASFSELLWIPDTVRSIGDRAFQGCYTVQGIYVPPTVVELGEDCFAEMQGDPYVIGVPGSYIETYCKMHHLWFVNVYSLLQLPFWDTDPTKWYYGAVSFAYYNELMNGMTETTFEPNRGLTRAMLVTVLWRMCGEEVVTPDHAFQDVRAGSYYETAVAWAAHYGIVNGITPTAFGPNQPVTREQAAAIFYRLTTALGLETSERGDLSQFQDSAQLSNYAKAPMAWAVGISLIQGKENQSLAPKGGATRAEVATILMRYVVYLSQQEA